MSISQSLLPEFDQEMASTRKTLERVPSDKFDWKSHEKSMAMGQLAGHIAEMCGWGTTTIKEESYDFAPVDGEPYKSPAINNTEELLAMFDKNVAEAREALANASDETLMQPWSLLNGGNALFTMPRIAVLRSFVMNHIIHHRAQLGVYFRLNDIPVPSVYGPTADEGKM